ncbi:folate-sensitive fragile site protein Fra10Ac1-domain-containing protein [Crucibulum laeve]|uniref:Folate-sensitive fragile site protein Fra10Ac1-domain-containing protein n=1 Tax=Crucibulum laeve TaxID=68775 RepID=A0A5C3M696_9AGAR|nr:folate-sensitive fragile site protein Fra10Ac1-domain-containing protein [Crucibulum laeve]
MALYQYGSSSNAVSGPSGKTEFEILKESHKFLRDEEGKNSTWDEQLAEKYYSSLYREFAVCDLKHYKSGNFALRWRTEEEVLSSAGETTCGNTRCEHHYSTLKPPLTTLELPFAYVEQGENKSALVKIVLCSSCLKKLMWKRNKEKAKLESGDRTQTHTPEETPPSSGDPLVPSARGEESRRKERRRRRGEEERMEDKRHRRRSSRSRSPRHRSEERSRKRKITPS